MNKASSEGLTSRKTTSIPAEKCPNTKLFNLNMGKLRPEKLPHPDIFHAVASK